MGRRYERQGLLAVNPQAFFELYLEAPDRSNTAEAGVAIVDVQGPLEQYKGDWCDSYEAIVERVGLACESGAHTVVLRLNSPGGLASGMVDAARAIRQKCAAAGKRLVAFVDGQACSAAYALACAAPQIVASETAIVGSVGVISCRIDVTEQDRMLGTQFAFVTSGARKTDGNPHSPVSEAELGATQRIVDSLASTFFELVEELRPVLPRAKVAALDAGLFHGASAKGVGLVDRVESYRSLLATLASAENGERMSTKYEDARAALGEVAGGEGADAERARKALAAMDGDDDEKKDEDKPDAEADDKPADDDEDKDEPDAQGEDVPDDDKKKKAEASAPSARVSASTAGELAAQVNSLASRFARLEAKNEALERRQFLSSRPDLAPGLVKLLDSKPLAEVRAIVGAIPAPKSPKLGDKAAAAHVAPTQGDHGATGARLSPEAKAALDDEMGLSAKQSVGVEKTPYRLVLGKPVDPRKAG